MHERWIADQRFDHRADQIALTEYHLAVQAADERVKRLSTALGQAAQGWRFEPIVAALRALRGIDTVSAIGLVCEIGDIQRFATARQLMGYLGLVPSECSSGPSGRRGSITKAGNAHARRLLTEAAWNYRFPARMSKELRERSKALPPGIRTHAWKAQVRLWAAKVRHVVDPDLEKKNPYGIDSSVKLILKDGRTVEHRTDYLRQADSAGTMKFAFMDDDRLVRKFRALTHGLLPAARQDRLLDIVPGLDAERDARCLWELLAQ